MEKPGAVVEKSATSAARTSAVPTEKNALGTLGYLVERRFFLGVFCIALLVRIICLLEISKAPFFGNTIGDAESYVNWATQIANGDVIGSKIFYQAPLYPYLLGAVFALFGRSIFLVLLLQAFLGACSALLLASAGARLFSEKVGLIAGLIAALYAPSIFFDCIVQKSSLDNFLFCFLLFLVASGATRKSNLLACGCGAVLGFLSLSRENMMLLFPALLLWFLLWGGRADVWQLRLRKTLFFLSGFVLVLAPVAARNYAVGGQWFITTSQFGPNLYIGNNEQADGFYEPIVKSQGNYIYERRDAHVVAEKEMKRHLSDKDVSRFWTAKALHFIRSHPGTWVALTAKKAFFALYAYEMPDTESLEMYRDQSLLLNLLSRIMNFGVLFAFGAAGVIVTRGQARKLWIIYLMFLFVYASIVPFFIFARYRFPLVPITCLFAAAGLGALLQALRTQNRSSLVKISSVVALVAVPLNWPLNANEKLSQRDDMFLNLGIAMLQKERFQDASMYFVKARTLNAANPVVYKYLGILHKRSGDIQGAFENYRKSIALDPDDFETHYDLALLYDSLGQWQEAKAAYHRALALNDLSLEAYNNLGFIYFRERDYGQSLENYRKALRLDSTASITYHNIGLVYHLQSDYPNAIRYYREALRYDARFVDAYVNLGQAYKSLGRRDDAIAALEAALRINPRSEDASMVLAKAKAIAQVSNSASTVRDTVTRAPKPNGGGR